jgi:hypothetical protein
MKKNRAKTNTLVNNWDSPAGRREIVRAVFQYIRDNPAEAEGILDYAKAREIVTRVGNTKIPGDVIVACRPLGDRNKPPGAIPSERGVGGSLILEIPPATIAIGSDEILTYSCTYPLWARYRTTRRSTKRRKAPPK